MMKKLLYLIILSPVIFLCPATGFGQSKVVSNHSGTSSYIKKLAEKRTQRMKDELFLSQDQSVDVMNITVKMLEKVEQVKKMDLNSSQRKAQLAQIENNTKNEIVPLLTPAQRKRFESTLFSEVYQTQVDKKHAVTEK